MGRKRKPGGSGHTEQRRARRTFHASEGASPTPRRGDAAYLRRRRRWLWLIAGLPIVALAGLTAVWWQAGSGDAAGGTPRLVADRTEVNLGRQPFDAPVRAVFTLTNAGDGLLSILGEPRVDVVEGC
jgi:hypothetical protein